MFSNMLPIKADYKAPEATGSRKLPFSVNRLSRRHASRRVALAHDKAPYPHGKYRTNTTTRGWHKSQQS